jgi:hypothetical protein
LTDDDALIREKKAGKETEIFKLTHEQVVFREIKSDLRVVIGSNEAEHWLFVINHETSTLQAAHPIAADYDVDPTKLKLSMSSDRFRFIGSEGEETYHQRY